MVNFLADFLAVGLGIPYAWGAFRTFNRVFLLEIRRASSDELESLRQVMSMLGLAALAALLWPVCLLTVFVALAIVNARKAVLLPGTREQARRAALQEADLRPEREAELLAGIAREEARLKAVNKATTLDSLDQASLGNSESAPQPQGAELVCVCRHSMALHVHPVGKSTADKCELCGCRTCIVVGRYPADNSLAQGWANRKERS